MSLTQKRLKELLVYDHHTGSFFWRVTLTGHIQANREAGSWHHTGYRTIRIDNKNYQAHRLAWLYMTGKWPKGEIDHRDLNRGNNRFYNLRDVSKSINQHNGKAYKNNKKQLKGICWLKANKKWMAQIQKDKINHYLGLFDTPEDAHKAYCEAARKLYGSYARVS